MRAPPNGRSRAPDGRPGLDTSTTTPLPSETTTIVMITEGPAAAVADLDAYRWRPWPGWWGSHEMACWSFAERSRRTA